MRILNKTKIWYLILPMIIGHVSADQMAPYYEIYILTKNVGESTTVNFVAETSESPRWDGLFNITTGMSSVFLSVEGNNISCTYGYDMNGTTSALSKIGHPLYKIKVTNSGKSSWFKVKSLGCQFQGDIFVTYDYSADEFYNGGSCTSHGTNLINGQTITMYDEDIEGNLCFQPENPTSLWGDEANNHPRLHWNDSEYPSWVTIKYKVWRRYRPSGGSWDNWGVIASNLSNTIYTDYEVNLNTKTGLFHYRVSAYVPAGKNSPGFTNAVAYSGSYLFKQMVFNYEQSLPKKYSIQPIQILSIQLL